MTAIAKTSPQRRGACPGSIGADADRRRPIGAASADRHDSARGLSLRLCQAARTYGNGVIEVTSRGSIQVRGLSEASAPRFRRRRLRRSILPRRTACRCCAIRSPDSMPRKFSIPTSLAAESAARIIAQSALAARLSPKVSVVIDGGGAIGLDTVAADIRLARGKACAAIVVLHVSVGGDEARAAELGSIAGARRRNRASLARCHRAARPRGARPRCACGRRATSVSLRQSATFCFLQSRCRIPACAGMSGMEPRRGDRHVFASQRRAAPSASALPSATLKPVRLERLIEAAQTAGATGLRTAPGRALLAIGLVSEDRAGICRKRRTSRLHHPRRRSAPQSHRLRRRADLRFGPHCLARARARYRVKAAPRSRHDSYFRLRQGLRAFRRLRRSPSSARPRAAR